MMEQYSLGEYYYKNKFQGERLRTKTYKGNTWYIIHASHIAYCIAKAEQFMECNRNGIKIPFSDYSINNMETGKAMHLLHQREIDPIMSELKLDWYGWYPYMHTPDGYEEFSSIGRRNNPLSFSECVEVKNYWWYRPNLQVQGRLDQYMMNDRGFFIRDIKSTRGFKYVKNAKFNHKIQVHVYILQSEFRENLYNKCNPFYRYVDFFGDMAKRKIRKADIKYVNMFDPTDIKLCNVVYRTKHVDYIYEQLDKYLHYITTGELTPPNYDTLMEWECNPKYCPFAKKSPLGEDCKFCQWDVNGEEEKK